MYPSMTEITTPLMLRDFVRATVAVQAAYGCSMDQAIQLTAQILGWQVPAQDAFNSALISKPARHRRGRPSAATLTSRDAVAIVAIYFINIGARPEQARIEAGRLLGVVVSRKVARDAILRMRPLIASSAAKCNAECVVAALQPTGARRLPTNITPAARRRKYRYPR